jgi:hypothetical protein
MRWIAWLLVVVLASCGGGQSFWLASAPPNAPTAPIDRTCWDACHARWNPGTMERAKCVSKCPNVETRKGSCSGAAANQCVADNSSAVTIILIGGIVATLVVIVAALLI